MSVYWLGHQATMEISTFRKDNGEQGPTEQKEVISQQRSQRRRKNLLLFPLMPFLPQLETHTSGIQLQEHKHMGEGQLPSNQNTGRSDAAIPQPRQVPFQLTNFLPPFRFFFSLFPLPRSPSSFWESVLKPCTILATFTFRTRLVATQCHRHYYLYFKQMAQRS